MKIRTFFTRLHPMDWLVIGLILLNLIPIWAFQYLPTQDGPSHLNNAQILSQYLNPAFNFQKIYSLRLDPFPNWFSYISLAALLRVFPPLVAEKMLLSMYVIGFPLAFIYFLSAIDPAKKPLGILSFVFIYNYLFIMGFFNFAFSIPLAFLTLGYFWKHRLRLTFGQTVVLNLLLLMLFFCHLITYLVILGSIAFISVIHFIHQWFSLHDSTFRQHVTSLGINLISLVPTLPLLVHYYLGSSFAGKVPHIDIGRIPNLLKDFFTLRILVSYESFHQNGISHVVTVLFVLLLIITLVKRISRIRFRQQRFLIFEDCILGLFLILFVFYLIMPWNFGSGSWFNDRLALLGSLFLLAWCDVTLPILSSAYTPNLASGVGKDSATQQKSSYDQSRPIGLFHEITKVFSRTWFNRVYPLALTGLFCLASLLVLSGVVYTFAKLEPVMQEYTSSIKLIKPNAVLLPLNFSTVDNNQLRTDPLLHASHYYTLSNGAINLGNYEPFADYFPLKYKPNLNLPIYLPDMDWHYVLEHHLHTLSLCSYTSMVDYLLIWDTPDLFFKADIDRCYNLLYAKGRQKIYIPNR